MKILWHSVPARYNTGYGCQTRLWTRALKEAGHDVTISGVAGSMPTYQDENGIMTLSQGTRQNMGNDFILAHMKEVKPDIVISMMDTFVIDCNKFKDLPWYSWVVVDSAPLMTRLVKPAKTAKGLLAMSRFGEDVLATAGFKSTYIPLACSRKEYFMQDREESRKVIGNAVGFDLSKAFLVMMNSANMSQPSRKNFGCAFKAFAAFKKICPRAVLYVHSERTGAMARGEDLDAIAKACGIDKSIIWAHQYAYTMGMIGADFMRAMYNAADVFLHTAMGEGFGLPLVEAQLCGCPVIAPEFSSSGELVENGIKITDGVQHIMWDASEQFIANPAAVAAALMNVLANPKPRTPLCAQYYIENVMERCFKPWIETVAKGIKHEPEVEANPGAPEDVQEPSPSGDNPAVLPEDLAGRYQEHGARLQRHGADPVPA